MQILLITTGAVLLFVFIAPVFDDVLNIGTAVGIMLGIYPLIVGLSWNKIPVLPRNILCCVYAAAFFAAALLMLWIYFSGKSSKRTADAVIVLGCSVKDDKPSLSLVKRTMAAYEFLINNNDAVAVLSGGQGPDENISEAQCMFNILTEMGIAADRLILEDKSVNTDENIRFSIKLMNLHNIPLKAAVASSEYHQLRAKMLCKKYGLIAFSCSSKTKPIILPTFLLREVFAVLRFLIFHK